MCGIFAYSGKSEDGALKAFRGLKDLEYRGYDSWGIAVQKEGGGIFYKKAIGSISRVNENDFRNIHGCIAIGHTRWATHGKVSYANTHPHVDKLKRLFVVHNGIIENYEQLREHLKRKLGKNIFKSETDTEVIPHLIDAYMRRGKTLEEAFIKTCHSLKGRFAFAVLSEGNQFVLAARSGSPLVVGRSNEGVFIASDIPAFLDYTTSVNYMENGEYVRADKNGASFYNLKTGKKVRKETKKVAWEKTHASRGGWDHFMIKEIMDQRETLLFALEQDQKNVEKVARLIRNSSHVIFSGAGTAGHIGMAGEYLFSTLSRTEARFVPAAEISKILPFVGAKSVFVGITQSGETADLLEAISGIKKRKGKVTSVLNVRGSSVERESSLFLPINAGPEKAVASTKAASAQLVAVFVLAMALGGKLAQGKKMLRNDIQKIREWLTPKLLSQIKTIAFRLREAGDIYVIGKGIGYPMALEGALKIKEVSYIHAEGFAAGELKHGPIALIEKGVPCVVLVAEDEFKEDMLLSAEELKARGAEIIGVGEEKQRVFDCFIALPKLQILTSVAHMIALQILAYYLAVLRGHDPDKPRNLAKSVTVK